MMHLPLFRILHQAISCNVNISAAKRRNIIFNMELSNVTTTYTHEGYCKHYIEDRGFGFFSITSHPNHRDCFFHIKDLEKVGIKQIKVGDRVRFSIVDDEKRGRQKAIDVQLVENAAR
jgi:cold shock CspA family protein